MFAFQISSPRPRETALAGFSKNTRGAFYVARPNDNPSLLHVIDEAVARIFDGIIYGPPGIVAESSR